MNCLLCAHSWRPSDGGCGDVAVQLREIRGGIGDRAPATIELMAWAGFLHTVYNGIENCLLRVADAVDESVPTGRDSHRLLLDQLSAPIGGLRPAVIGESLLPTLDEYRRFRRAFRHMYFFDLEWDRIRPLADSSGEVVQAVEDALDVLLDTLAA